MKWKEQYRIAQVKNLDPEERKKIFTEIWMEYGKQISYFIAQIIPTEHEHFEDLFQDIMMKIYENLSHYNPLGSFEAWAYSIARNRCIDHLRTLRLYETIDEEIFDAGENPDKMVICSELDKAIRQALTKLKSTDKQIAYLRYFEGMRLSQIADVMDMNVNTIKTRITAIKRVLRAELEDWV